MSLIPSTGMSDFFYELQLIGYMTPVACRIAYGYLSPYPLHLHNNRNNHMLVNLYSLNIDEIPMQIYHFTVFVFIFMFSKL